MTRPPRMSRRTLLRCPEGAVGVEFALLLPILVLLLTGMLATAQMITVAGKVSTAASAMADLITQSRSVSAADRTDAVTAAQLVLYPNPVDAGVLGGRILCVSFSMVGGAYQPAIVWQHSFGTVPGAAPNLSPLAALAQPGVSVVHVSLTYAHHAIVSNPIFDTVNFTRTATARMRLTSTC